MKRPEAKAARASCTSAFFVLTVFSDFLSVHLCFMARQLRYGGVPAKSQNALMHKHTRICIYIYGFK